MRALELVGPLALVLFKALEHAILAAASILPQERFILRVLDNLLLDLSHHLAFFKLADALQQLMLGVDGRRVGKVLAATNSRYVTRHDMFDAIGKFLSLELRHFLGLG